MFFSNILHLAGVWISRRGRSVPWRTCVARRDPAHMHAHTRGGGTRTVCLTPGYRAWQTYGLHHSAAKAAEPPRLTNAQPAAEPPRLTNAQSTAEPHDPVRGQSSVAGNVNPRLGGALENDRGAGVDCDGIRNAPPRNAMACDVTIWGGSFL